MGGKRTLALIALLMVGALFVSCAKKVVMVDDDELSGAAGTQVGDAGTTDQGAIGAGDVSQDKRPMDGVALKHPELDTVYFDYDKYNLRPDAVATLKENLRWLRRNPDKAILIEGHCDERGSEEYNISLGEKRAQSVLSFLVQSGIDKERIFTISYGEEFPVDPGHNEAAWAKNRRAEFKVYQ